MRAAHSHCSSESACSLFFFQAEDGIRDIGVTGVQTCALPICVDGGKKIRGVKIQIAVEKYGIPLAIDISPANTHDTKGIIPVLRDIAGQGFRGPALADLGYRGQRLAKLAETLGLTIEPIARGRDGKFFPAGI